MFDITHYMEDGANWQAQAVAICIKGQSHNITNKGWNTETKRSDLSIEIGRYENCREQGYVISLCYKYIPQRCYCVFEHRNSDNLCLIAFESSNVNTPSIDEVWKDRKNKYDVTHSVLCGQITEMVDYILDDMQLVVNKCLE